jgi:AraC-like DNA-binding protein
MALEAGMSRARFAEHFRKVVGQTPAEYLQYWRLTLARKQLLAGNALKQIAPAVGYQSVAAFHRVFRQRFGVSPKEWLEQLQSPLAEAAA